MRRRKRHEKIARRGNVFVLELTNTVTKGGVNTVTFRHECKYGERRNNIITVTDPSHKPTAIQ